MNTQILDGKKLGLEIRKELAQKLNLLRQDQNRSKEIPGLAAILVGNDPASQVYIKQKENALKEIGFHSEIYRLPGEILQADLLSLIQTLNHARHIDGILVQLPLPPHLKPEIILHAVNPSKDVDGFHIENLGKLFSGNPRFIPCTPKGILRLLQNALIDIKGKKAVVVGRSLIVGKPMALLLLQEDATVAICHSRTQHLEKECSTADLLIVAIGKPLFVKSTFVKKNAVVVDVGIHRTPNGLVGDVDYKEVSKIASYITPVPGGVGPMTIAMLLENTWESFLKRD